MAIVPNWKSRLRKELAERAECFAKANSLTHYKSCAQKDPTILFPADRVKSRHGNFNDKSYQAILAKKSWAKRLNKRHPTPQALPKRWQRCAKELDSSNSSDVLLMNCFCYPGAAERILRSCLGVTATGLVEFGVDGKVPKCNGESDKTELDMRVGNTICEAKLTESGFTTKCATRVKAYRGFHGVFDAGQLPQDAGKYQSYQLIRNVLAAAAHGYEFVLLCDARRPDLLRYWWAVHTAIRDAALRARCHFLLWQEVAQACPTQLREYLGEKYGL